MDKKGKQSLKLMDKNMLSVGYKKGEETISILDSRAPPCLIEERFSGHGCHTLYFYITTVVINEKKRSLDVLCIEIIIYVQNALFPQIFFC